MKKNYLIGKGILSVLSISILMYLTITGSECEDALNAIAPDVPGDIVGSWKLTEQTGSAQDICPNETVVFQTSGQAQLTCPNSNTITRNFQVVNNVLTYTETSISYNVEFANSNQELLLTGTNVNRNLKYQKIVTAPDPIINAPGTDFINSSDKRR
ncbi:MAG TPA: hypothetical protein PK536_06655 [Ignavibacteria bacterium]|nr:hypothetical protein [Bacteroidota bacterium]HRI85111.1 hypothetical protein [Ignavibacteria bacterium]HRK00297.1 hypothetical protein [Ignavibacteria bacterium]